MLLRADQHLARRDRAVPGMDLVLDPNAIAARLGETGLAVRSATATYVRYKPGTCCLVGYRLDVDGAAVDAYAKAVDAASSQKAQKLAVRAAASPGHGTYVPEAVTAIATYPYDHSLPVLARLDDPERCAPILSRLLDLPAATGGIRLERLHYKPERRYVARLDVPDRPPMVLKVYDEAGFRHTSRAAKALGNRGTVPVSRRVGASDRHRLIAYEWLEGVPLDPVGPGASHMGDVMRDVGAVLARLHTRNAGKLPRQGPTDAALTVLVAGRAITDLLPEAGPDIHDVATRVAARLLDSHPTPVVTHGDFTSDQVVVTTDGPAFVDIDRAAVGHAATDLGSFVADLHVRALYGHLREDAVGALADAFVAGHAGVAGPHARTTLATWTAAALLRRATEPFRLRMERWPVVARAIVDRAREVVP